MNKRIKKIIEQAWVEANLACNQDPKANWAEIRDEKFAELIVRECLEVVRQSDDECYDEWDYADRDLCGIIEEHFGVKE